MPSSVVDYAGRTADYAAFQVVLGAGTKVQLLSQELVRPGTGGALVAGVQKLAQRVLITLLTKLGSHPYRPGYGTQFLVDAVRGRWRTVPDVEQSFYSARTDLRRQIQAVERAADPPDERYGGLELTGVTLSGAKVTVHLKLTTLAGTGYTYLTPISVTLR